jgi:TRAP-type uncharacterized transport system substrate-binding protein
MIKKLFLCILGVCIPLMGISETKELVITSGKTGGAYDNYANKLQLLLRSAYGIKIISSAGGYENLTRIALGEAQLGFAQADTVLYYYSEGTQNITKVQLVKPLNKECVFLVAKDDGKVHSDTDLQKSGIKVAIGDLNSGSYYTYHTMIKMESAFSNSSKIVVGGLQSLSLLSTGNIDAIIFVTNPDNLFNTEMHRNIMRLKLSIKPIEDWDLNDSLPNTNKPIYSFEKIKVNDNYFGGTVSTICMDSYLISSPNIDETLLSRLFLFDPK